MWKYFIVESFVLLLIYRNVLNALGPLKYLKQNLSYEFDKIS